MIIYLIPLSRNAPEPIRRRSDRFSSSDATYPRMFVGPAVLPLFCLAPHGVFRASRITPRAVSSYLAFSPLPVYKKQLFFQRTGGVFSVTLSVTAIFQPRRPRLLCGMLPYGVRTFLQRSGLRRITSDHLPSADILAHFGLAAPTAVIAIRRRFQQVRDDFRPRTIGDAMAMNSCCRCDKSRSNRASPGQIFQCKWSATFASAHHPAR